MRSAVAFDAGALITTMRHSPTESGVLAKSASGALELIPYIQITNLADTLEELHELGFMTIGLDSEGPQPLEGTFAGDKIALVLGSEGKGLRQKTRQTVKALARLDMPGAIKSLNVSNAAPSRCTRRDIILRDRSRRDDRHGEPRRRAAVLQSFPCRDVEVHFAAREIGDIADADAGSLPEFVFRSVAVSAGATPARRRRGNTSGHQGDGRERQRQKPQGAHAFHARQNSAVSTRSETENAG